MTWKEIQPPFVPQMTPKREQDEMSDQQIDTLYLQTSMRKLKPRVCIQRSLLLDFTQAFVNRLFYMICIWNGQGYDNNGAD